MNKTAPKLTPPLPVARATAVKPDEDPFQDFVVRLRSVPCDVPATNRARRALKCLLRSFGFRAEIIHQCSEPAVKKESPK